MDKSATAKVELKTKSKNEREQKVPTSQMHLTKRPSGDLTNRYPQMKKDENYYLHRGDFGSDYECFR